MIPVRLSVISAILLFGAGTLDCNAAIMVACIGDSITAGVGVTTPSVESYPAKLQQLLGTNYNVLNYGVSGTTLLTQGDMPYWNTGNYTASHNPPLPNIVVIMLGSNDSKPQNWQYGGNFYVVYRAFIATYTNLASAPRVLLCTPPPCFGPNSPLIDPGVLATNISPLIRQIGTNLNHQVIDMQTLLAGHGEWFPDNVHPNSQGTAVMSAIVYTALLGDTMNGAIPGLGIDPLTNSIVSLNWPAGGAGWVLQSIPAFGGTNAWTIVAQRSINDGTWVRNANAITGPSALFRLWNPSIQSP